MRAPILQVALLATSLFTQATSKTLKNPPQLRTNATLHPATAGSLTTRDTDIFNLAPRDYYTCDPGYSSCAYDSSRCCPSDNTCCGNGYCADPGDVCCTVGTCPSGWNCCGNEGYCSPVDGECCSDGYYCFAGTHCTVWDGERVCCPESGCLGASDEGDLGSTISAGPVEPTVTPGPSSYYSYYSSAWYVDYDYYYTTVYWTYWFYFWTSYYPYTVQTVTSTETTTYTIWSVYATNSAEASESLSYSAESYSFSTPYSATYLESSTNPVPLSTSGVSSPTSISSNSNGPGIFANAASGVPDDRSVLLMGMAVAGVIGGVALLL